MSNIQNIPNTASSNMLSTIQIIQSIKNNLPGYICTITRFICRIIAIGLLQIFGWIMSDESRTRIIGNTSNVVYVPNNCIWDRVLLLLVRVSLSNVSVPVYIENITSQPASIRSALEHIGYRDIKVLDASSMTPCFVQSTVQWENILTSNANTNYLFFNYNSHTVTYSTTPDNTLNDIPLGSTNVLTSIINWKTLVFGLLCIYFGLFISLWCYPVFFILWAMWRNSVLLVNQPDIIVSAANTLEVPADITAIIPTDIIVTPPTTSTTTITSQISIMDPIIQSSNSENNNKTDHLD